MAQHPHTIGGGSDADYQGQIAALHRSLAVIEFNLDGIILSANDNLLNMLGYRLDELRGQHHSLFVAESSRHSSDYLDFWAKLARGEFHSGEFKRLGKDGREVWIQATYNPVFNAAGQPVKVVKFASDVTQLKLQNADYQGQIAAIGKSQAVSEFAMDGTILSANPNFLHMLGYSLDEIRGKHHSMFATEEYARSNDYKEFWAQLRSGEYEAGEFKRIGKGGKEVWIQASYNPIFDLNNRPCKIVKYSTDVTALKLQNADYQGQIAAISRSQAVIEFCMDGTILSANSNFLQMLGYSLDEIRGKHHSMFADPHYARSTDYMEFWAQLRRGEHEVGEFKRLGKGGKEVWIQASYNPIFDLNNRPFKVVKYAADVTQLKLQSADYEGQIIAIGKSQAVAEFRMDGTIIRANKNFLKAFGYTLAEIRGKHHRIFVTPQYAASADYHEFWEKLARGDYHTGEFKRVAKDGRDVWIQASYNPILDLDGRPTKVVKYSTDVTAQKLLSADYQAQIEAISQSLAVIEFNLDGTVRAANDNFLGALGYTFDEIRGQHHRMFTSEADANSPAYREFWAKLTAGEFQSGQFLRIGKGGKEVWLQASYNPILDMNGKPFKVVKYAMDVTAAIHHVQPLVTR